MQHAIARHRCQLLGGAIHADCTHGGAALQSNDVLAGASIPVPVEKGLGVGAGVGASIPVPAGNIWFIAHGKGEHLQGLAMECVLWCSGLQQHAVKFVPQHTPRKVDLK